MTDSDEQIEARVRAAFASEQRRAESDLRRAPLQPHRRSRLRLIPPLAAVALVAVLVVVAAGLSYNLRYAATGSPAPSSSPSSSTLESSPPSLPSPSLDRSALAGRYEDGIPRTFDGQPVLREQVAIDAANASTDASSFLVAFWAGKVLPFRSCVALGLDDNALYKCGSMSNVGDQPGIRSFELGMALRVDTSAVAPGPVIARVHTHDPAMMTCPASYAAGCVHTMVGEAIVWHGDAETAPRPTTVAQAAAAFGVSATPAAGICEGDFPGVAVLQYPSPDNPGLQAPEGAIAVFPSAAALAAAAPDAAAHGESDVWPTGSLACASGGTDPLRGPGAFSFKFHWLARGNVLVAVQYDTSVGPQNDVIVAQVRAKLATLSAAGQALSPTLAPSPGPSATSRSGTFVLAGPVPFPESGPGQPAALLADGRVLVMGDTGAPAEALFDPATGRFSITGSLSTRRANATATSLKDGRVLVAGGEDETGVLASAELYDPATAKFSPTGSMLSPREFDTATLLTDGRVLILGGIGKGGTLASAELYDPATGRFSSAGNTLAPLGEGHSSTLLLDGRVLIAGGDGSSSPVRLTDTAEIYDPTSGRFSSTGSMTTPRAFHTATLLTDGRVLLAGGEDSSGFSSSAQLYDPSSGTFGATGSMSSARQNHVAVRLDDGRVLVAGGDIGTGNRLVSAELYDAATGRFGPTGNMTTERVGLTATLLLDGRVLVVGANVTGTGIDIANEAELYLP
jgi:Galactose oxidase, central domain